MKRKLFWKALWIVLILAAAVWIALPSTHGSYFGSLSKTIELRKGLDLAGGSHLVYELDLTNIDNKDKNNAVSGVVQTIDRRVNALGVTEPTIQEGRIGDKRTVIVELPGISNTKDAIALIGQTAKLEFYEQGTGDTTDSLLPGFVASGLTGADLKSADVQIQPTGQGNSTLSAGEPVVSLSFNSDGQKKFADITRRNIGKPVAIVIDGQVISAPTVQTEISDGNAVISGSFDVASARQLSIALKSGQLPVPITLVQEKTVGATLGAASIEKSLLAGAIGILLVIIFMIAYYGIKGIFASVALIIYTIIVFALFKFIPVTLTLAGIAGLILSIGAAVDANILIFERMKEEQRHGKHIQSAIDEGFRRAWSSIRDSNSSSIITALILILFGTGIVKGFALTLLIGILVSLFSAITISQTLLKLFLQDRRIR